MTNKTLQNFYTERYKENENLYELKYQKIPYDRNSVAFKYFIDNFKSGNILEIGAGNGLMAYSLLKSSLKINKYIAIELSESRANRLNEKLKFDNFKAIEENIEELNTDIGKFDAIIMIALIEHLIDPLGTLKYIKKNLLKDNGFVYINTPNFADIGCRKKLLFGKFPSTSAKDEGLTTYNNQKVKLYDEGHLHYFTFSSLSKMLKRYCGFTELEIIPQPIGKNILGKKFHYFMAKSFPTLFSELNLVAK
jgi:2-polyprenyl-3-methyl-5-hydroxy-6-metoxy-1,4-benzoquinol methylase